MTKELVYNDGKILYEIRQSRGRAIRITVRPDGRVFLSIPSGVRMQHAMKFFESNTAWIVARLEHFRKHSFHQIPQRMKKSEFDACKRHAAALVNSRLTYFNALYGFSFKNIYIRNQKTRWGSCSAKGNLNFNARIALLPAHLVDYIIVHELCHIRELNHSPAFWHLVAQSIPDYRNRRKELRKAGLPSGATQIRTQDALTSFL